VSRSSPGNPLTNNIPSLGRIASGPYTSRGKVPTTVQVIPSAERTSCSTAGGPSSGVQQAMARNPSGTAIGRSTYARAGSSIRTRCHVVASSDHHVRIAWDVSNWKEPVTRMRSAVAAAPVAHSIVSKSTPPDANAGWSPWRVQRSPSVEDQTARRIPSLPTASSRSPHATSCIGAHPCGTPWNGRRAFVQVCRSGETQATLRSLRSTPIATTPPAHATGAHWPVLRARQWLRPRGAGR